MWGSRFWGPDWSSSTMMRDVKQRNERSSGIWGLIVGAMQRMRRESTVDVQVFVCVCVGDNPDMWAQEECAWKTRFYNQFGHLQVSTTSPCVAALQILFRRIGIYLSFLNEEIERSESVRNLPELWVRPGVCYHTFWTFLSINNGENSFTGKSMIQFHDLKFPWKG